MESDMAMAELIDAAEHQALVDYHKLPHVSQAIPTEEHYLPLLYVLGAVDEGEPVEFFNVRVTLGSVSMRGVRLG